MPKFQILIKADLENIESITTGENFEYFIDVACSQCHEVHPGPISLNSLDAYNVPNSRATANLVMKCKFCKKNGSFVIHPSSFAPYTDSTSFAPIVTIEARGFDIVGFQFREGWVLKSSVSETTWCDVNLYEEWGEYDESGGEPVGVSEIEAKVVKLN